MDDHMEKTANRSREARLRRAAASMGLALRKSRARDPNRMDFGCYRIVDAMSGCPVAGTYPYVYSLDLDAVEEALEQLFASPAEEAQMSRGTPAHGCAGGADPKWER
jgi:hypothetical protein